MACFSPLKPLGPSVREVDKYGTGCTSLPSLLLEQLVPETLLWPPLHCLLSSVSHCSIYSQHLHLLPLGLRHLRTQSRT